MPYLIMGGASLASYLYGKFSDNDNKTSLLGYFVMGAGAYYIYKKLK